jgi:hypothetical protein
MRVEDDAFSSFFSLSKSSKRTVLLESVDAIMIHASWQWQQPIK